MSDPRIDKLHALGRMLKNGEDLVDKLLTNNRLNISDEAKDFSRAVIDYSREHDKTVDAADVRQVFELNFTTRENVDEFRKVANIIEEEFNDPDDDMMAERHFR